MLRICRIARARSLVIAFTFFAIALGGCASHAPRYDVFNAMRVLETQAPEDGTLFTKFNIPVGSNVEEAAGNLEPVLQEAAGRMRRVGIIGADAQLNVEVTLNALARSKPAGLAGLTIVYMAPAQPPESIHKAVDRVGAKFIFVKYP